MQKIPARWYRALVAGRSIKWVVVHSMEAANKSTTAENVARYFAMTDKKVSAHVCADMDSLVRCVDDKDIAYCAPAANSEGLHIELAGYAAYQRGEWTTPQMLSMLYLAAQQIREWCVTHSIPMRYVDAAGLLRGERGITTHAEVSKAWRQSDHTDPGKDFPMAQLIAMITSQEISMAKKIDIKITKSGAGYWIFGEDGGVFAFGDAAFYGSMGGQPLAASIVSVDIMPNDDGYILLGADGGTFHFGSAAALQLGNATTL